MQPYTVCFIWELLYMFRMVPPPIMEDLELIWVWCSKIKPVPALPRQGQVAAMLWQILDAVDTVVCAVWCYHPKYVEEFPDKMNCVTLHLVGYIIERDVISCTERNILKCFWTAHTKSCIFDEVKFNPLNPELNPICYLLALLGAHHFLHVSRIRVKLLTLGY